MEEIRDYMLTDIIWDNDLKLVKIEFASSQPKITGNHDVKVVHLQSNQLHFLSEDVEEIANALRVLGLMGKDE